MNGVQVGIGRPLSARKWELGVKNVEIDQKTRRKTQTAPKEGLSDRPYPLEPRSAWSNGCAQARFGRKQPRRPTAPPARENPPAAYRPAGPRNAPAAYRPAGNGVPDARSS